MPLKTWKRISAKIGASMATRTRNGGGDDSLAEAMNRLIQNQAIFVSHLDEDRRRFSRIESELEQIKSLLLQHDQILKNLPEAIRQKIGFKKS
jgi:hypothetical protein